MLIQVSRTHRLMVIALAVSVFASCAKVNSQLRKSQDPNTEASSASSGRNGESLDRQQEATVTVSQVADYTDAVTDGDAGRVGAALDPFSAVNGTGLVSLAIAANMEAAAQRLAIAKRWTEEQLAPLKELREKREELSKVRKEIKNEETRMKALGRVVGLFAKRMALSRRATEVQNLEGRISQLELALNGGSGLASAEQELVGLRDRLASVRQNMSAAAKTVQEAEFKLFAEVPGNLAQYNEAAAKVVGLKSTLTKSEAAVKATSSRVAVSVAKEVSGFMKAGRELLQSDRAILLKRMALVGSSLVLAYAAWDGTTRVIKIVNDMHSNQTKLELMTATQSGDQEVLKTLDSVELNEKLYHEVDFDWGPELAGSPADLPSSLNRIKEYKLSGIPGLPGL